MIKNKFQLAIAIAAVWVVVTSVALYASASVTDSPKERGDIMVYSFEYDVFQEFINKPSLEILEQQGNSTMISIFTNINSSEGRIKREIINKEPIQVDETNGGELKIGNLPIYSSLIDFTHNKESLKKVLTENGVVGEIENVTILDIRNMAVTIWLEVNQEDYFITVDERYDDYAARSDKSEYVYRLYSYFDYYNKFGVKDGNLFVNGENITGDNYVKVHYSGAYLPFRAVMESLGAKVNWDPERNAVLLSYNDKKYVFKPDNLSLVEMGTTTNILMTPPGGAYYYCKIIDDKTIINHYAMQAIVRLMGAKINIDYNNLIVEINQQS